jgi:hypothetical protein
VPTWRAEYFDRGNSRTPERSVIIAAESETVALEEVRARMAPTCSRAEVTSSLSDWGFDLRGRGQFCVKLWGKCRHQS